MIQILVLCAMALSIGGSAIAAEPSENGRYQAVTIEMGGTGLAHEVLILDTKDGHLWRYWQRIESCWKCHFGRGVGRGRD